MQQLRIKPKMVKRTRRWCYGLTADYVHTRGSVLPCFKGNTLNSARDTWRTLHDFIFSQNWHWQVKVWAKFDYQDGRDLKQYEGKREFRNRTLPSIDNEVEALLEKVKEAGNRKFLVDWGWQTMILTDDSVPKVTPMEVKLIRKLEKELSA